MKRPVIIAHEYIRNRILSGEFATGDTLSTKHLADDIGVSRTPIRDALRQLETEGLVEIYPRQEARVKQASYEELRDIWELRIAQARPRNRCNISVAKPRVHRCEAAASPHCGFATAMQWRRRGLRRGALRW